MCHEISVQFSDSVLSDSATPWTVAHQASLSITNSWRLLKLMSVELVMPSHHLILCCLLLKAVQEERRKKFWLVFGYEKVIQGILINVLKHLYIHFDDKKNEVECTIPCTSWKYSSLKFFDWRKSNNMVSGFGLWGTECPSTRKGFRWSHRFEGQDNELCVRFVQFEMPVGQQNRDVQEAVNNTYLKFRRVSGLERELWESSVLLRLLCAPKIHQLKF